MPKHTPYAEHYLHIELPSNDITASSGEERQILEMWLKERVLDKFVVTNPDQMAFVWSEDSAASFYVLANDGTSLVPSVSVEVWPDEASAERYATFTHFAGSPVSKLPLDFVMSLAEKEGNQITPEQMLGGMQKGFPLCFRHLPEIFAAYIDKDWWKAFDIAPDQPVSAFSQMNANQVMFAITPLIEGAHCRPVFQTITVEFEFFTPKPKTT